MDSKLFDSVRMRGITSKRIRFTKENVDEIGEVLGAILSTKEEYRLFDKCYLYISGNKLNLNSGNIKAWLDKIGESNTWLNTCKNSTVIYKDTQMKKIEFNINFDIEFSFKYKDYFEIKVDVDYSDDSIYAYMISDVYV